MRGKERGRKQAREGGDEHAGEAGHLGRSGWAASGGARSGWPSTQKRKFEAGLEKKSKHPPRSPRGQPERGLGLPHRALALPPACMPPRTGDTARAAAPPACQRPALRRPPTANREPASAVISTPSHPTQLPGSGRRSHRARPPRIPAGHPTCTSTPVELAGVHARCGVWVAPQGRRVARTGSQAAPAGGSPDINHRRDHIGRALSPRTAMAPPPARLPRAGLRSDGLQGKRMNIRR